MTDEEKDQVRERPDNKDLTELLGKLEPEERHLVVLGVSGIIHKQRANLRHSLKHDDYPYGGHVYYFSSKNRLHEEQEEKLKELDIAYEELMVTVSETAGYFAKRKEFERAGELYNHIGENESSIDCYAKADKPEIAGRVAEESGDLDRAEQFFVDAKDLESASRVSEKSGKLDKVIKYNLKLADENRDCFWVSKYYYKAGKAAGELGDHEKEIHCFIRSGVDDKIIGEIAEEHNLSEVAMRCYADKGEHGLAGHFAEKSGFEDLAIGHYKRAEEWNDVGRVYESLENLESAAKFYARCKDHGAMYRFERRTGETDLAEKCLVEEGEFYTAALIAKHNGRPEQAIDYFAQGGNLSYAAELAKSIGDQDRANKYGETEIKNSLEQGNLTGIGGINSVLEYMELPEDRKEAYTRVIDLVTMPTFNR